MVARSSSKKGQPGWAKGGRSTHLFKKGDLFLTSRFDPCGIVGVLRSDQRQLGKKDSNRDEKKFNLKDTDSEDIRNFWSYFLHSEI